MLSARARNVLHNLFPDGYTPESLRSIPDCEILLLPNCGVKTAQELRAWSTGGAPWTAEDEARAVLDALWRSRRALLMANERIRSLEREIERHSQRADVAAEIWRRGLPVPEHLRIA